MIAAQDPDSFIQAHGGEAMAGVIEGAAPLQAHLVADAWQHGAPDRLGERVTVTETALLDCAAWCLRTVMLVRRGERREVEDRSAQLQRAVIAVAARGMLAHARCDAIPIDAFTGPERLLAWTCACRAALALGRRASFAAARYALGTLPRLELPREVELEVVLGAQDELDLAEDITNASPSAVAALLQDMRARRTRAWLTPVLAGLDGEPMADTAMRLHQAADIYEGR